MIRPTFAPTRAQEYRAPGGAWSGPTLDARLAAAAPMSTEVAVAGFAGALRAAGIAAGDAVSWQSPNREEVALAYRACWRIGAIAAPMHHQLGSSERARLLAEVAPRLVIDLDTLPAGGAPVTQLWPEPESVAAVLFTSGSSGAPKGAIHTQATLATKATTMAAVHGIGQELAQSGPAHQREQAHLQTVKHPA